MNTNQVYLIIDIGTGNVRVSSVSASGKILSIKRDNVHYERDNLYPEALYFDPDQLWSQIVELTSEVFEEIGDVSIRAITASSQREGVVLLDREGKSLIGLPNHDHRGREWEKVIPDKHRVYQLTGRYPTSLFSALKILALKARHEDMAGRISSVMSISDWAQYRLTGITGYEHSQASETILYDVQKGEWSEELCNLFGISPGALPALLVSGTIQGSILPEYERLWGLSPGVPVVVGGADTQLAIKSTCPAVDDIVIVSGTTTPVIKVIRDYQLDKQERTWTNRHVEKDQFILETNCGVTGLNYQRLKELFYPHETYETIETELDQLKQPVCIASLGSLVASEKSAYTTGGFVFNVPVSHELARADFVQAVLWEIACAIKENFDSLIDLGGYDKDYVWACGGGFQSRHLRQFVAGLIDRRVRIRSGYQQASVTGGALLCAQALNDQTGTDEAIETVEPQFQELYQQWYGNWRQVRKGFGKMIS